MQLISLDNINTIEYLSVRYNDNLNSFSLPNLTTIDGALDISNNDNLSFFGFSNDLTSINGDLEVNDNDNLSSLSGLENIESGVDNLTINSNSDLYSLYGLHNLNSIAGDLAIRYNTQLTLSDFCSVQQLMFNLVGSYTVEYNGANPTIEEIKALTCN